MTKRSKYAPPPEKIRFEVTQEHIDRGKSKNALDCPVALALDQALDDRYAVIGFYHIFLHSKVYMEQPTICVRTPENIREYITNYDNNVAVEPATFELEF